MPAGMEWMKVRITGGVGTCTVDGETMRMTVDDDDGVNLSLSDKDGTALRGRRDGDVFRGELFLDGPNLSCHPEVPASAWAALGLRRRSGPAGAEAEEELEEELEVELDEEQEEELEWGLEQHVMVAWEKLQHVVAAWKVLRHAACFPNGPSPRAHPRSAEPRRRRRAAARRRRDVPYVGAERVRRRAAPRVAPLVRRGDVADLAVRGAEALGRRELVADEDHRRELGDPPPVHAPPRVRAEPPHVSVEQRPLRSAHSLVEPPGRPHLRWGVGLRKGRQRLDELHGGTHEPVHLSDYHFGDLVHHQASDVLDV
eukprot:gene10646-biopygen5556